MRTLAWLVLLFWLSGGVFAAAEYLHEAREPTALEQAAFARLKNKFPGAVLDANLRTFRNLAESPEYLTFLAEAYPDAAPLKAFEEIIDFEKIMNRILPPKERYLSFYRAQFGAGTVDEVTDEEHFLVHFDVTTKWVREASKAGGELSNAERTDGMRRMSGRTPARLMGTSAAREMLARRFGIDATIKLTQAEWTPIVQYFKMPLGEVADAHLAEDVRWIKTVFETYGQADGSLQIALQDPLLFNRIVYAFNTDKTFLTWVYPPVDRHQKARLLPGLKPSASPPKER